MRLSSIFKGHWAARSCAKQSKGEENPAIHLSLSVLFMLYSPLCLILYGQQQLGCDRHRRKRYKSCVWLYLAVTELIEIKGKSLTQPVTFTFLSSAKRSRETHFYWCFPAMCLSDSQVFISSQSFSGDTEESSCVPPEKWDFSHFLFSHIKHENIIITQKSSAHSPVGKGKSHWYSGSNPSCPYLHPWDLRPSVGNQGVPR